MANQATKEVDAIIEHAKAEVANELERRHGPSTHSEQQSRPPMANAWIHKPDKAPSKHVEHYRY